jgi:hypothetical protein
MLYPSKEQAIAIEREEAKQCSQHLIDCSDTVPIEFKEGEGWVEVWPWK